MRAGKGFVNTTQYGVKGHHPMVHPKRPKSGFHSNIGEVTHIPVKD